jgi:hypothetical protein
MMRKAITSVLGRAATIVLLLSLAALGNSLGGVVQSRTANGPAEIQGKQFSSFSQFVAAVHQVETTGRTGFILGDSRRSLGPLQISEAAWHDALSFDPSIGGKYSDCKNLKYATRIMNAYLNRHMPEAVKRGNWEACARLWNSGPAWHTKAQITNEYWAQVRRQLAVQRNTLAAYVTSVKNPS